MPDISMCSKRSCPHRATCYRYLAVPSRWQSYTSYTLGRPPAMACEGHWDTSKECGPVLRPPDVVDAEWDEAYRGDQEESP